MWLSPRYRTINGLLLRVEYEALKEPDYIVKFRERFGELKLAAYTWVPQDGNQVQELFVRRVFDSDTNAFGLELIVWDKLEDYDRRLFFDGQTFKLFMAVVGDMLTKPTKWPSTERSDNRVIEARLAVDENGEPTWYADRGKWRRDETAYKRFVNEGRGRARALKGRSKEGGDLA